MHRPTPPVIALAFALLFSSYVVAVSGGPVSPLLATGFATSALAFQGLHDAR